MGYPNLPLGGLGAASNDPLGRSIDDNDLFNQLRAKQLQSQLMQANQQAALMGASGMFFKILFCFFKNLFSILKKISRSFIHF